MNFWLVNERIERFHVLDHSFYERFILIMRSQETFYSIKFVRNKEVQS